MSRHGISRGDAGTATVAELARHWSVCGDTAREIVARAQLRDVSLNGVARFRWVDVWRLEGEPWVAPAGFGDYRAPLLHPRDLPVGVTQTSQGKLRR